MSVGLITPHPSELSSGSLFQAKLDYQLGKVSNFPWGPSDPKAQGRCLYNLIKNLHRTSKLSIKVCPSAALLLY